MSVIKAARKFKGQRASVEYDWSSGISISASEVWEIQTDDPTDGWNQIITDPLVPQIGFELVTGGVPTGYYVVGVSPSQNDDNPTIWTADIDLEMPKPGQQGEAGQPQENPLQRAIGVAWRFGRTEYPSHYDLDGKPFVNSYGDPYSKPLMVPTNAITKIVSHNVASYKASIIADWNNAVNSEVYDGFAKYSLRLTIKPSAKQTENGIDFYTISYEMEYNPLLWHPYQEPDVGYRYKNSVGVGQPAEENGVWLSSPVPLLNGFKNTTGTMDYNDFRKYKLKDFYKVVPA